MAGEGAHGRARTGATLAWTVLAVALAYAATARLGLVFAVPPEYKASAVWPASGIALAALLIYGRSAAPGVWLGAFLANAWDAFAPHTPASPSAHLYASAAIATGSALQALLGHALIRSWHGTEAPLERAAGACRFVAAILAMCLIGATCGVASLWAAGLVADASLASTWRTWWLGDVTGALIVGSLLLTWRHPPPIAWDRARLLEGAALAGLSLALAATIFRPFSPAFTFPPPLPFLLVPLLLWATFRFGTHGAAAAICLVNAVAVAGTFHGGGPFAHLGVASPLMPLQLFMTVVSATILVVAAVLDEMRRAEARAQQWQAVFTGATWAVAVIDADGRFRAVNPAFATLHGSPAGALPGTRLADVVAPECLDGWHARPDDGRGADAIYETTHVRRDGRRFPCRVHVTTVRDADGRVLYRAGTFEDLTEAKHAEAALRDSERRYRLLAEAMPHMVWSLWPDLQIDFLNPRALEFWGKSIDEINARGWFEAIHPDDRASARDAIEGPVRRGEPYEHEVRLRDGTGEYRWLLARMVPLKDEAGRLVKWIGSALDVHDRRLAAEQIRASERRFSGLAAAVPGFLLMNRADGWCEYCSPKFYQYTGLPEGAAAGLGWAAAIHPDERVAAIAHYQACVRDRGTFERQLRFRAAAGHYRWFLVRHVPVTDPHGADPQGAVTLWCGIGTDIDDQKRAEERLREVNAALEHRIAGHAAALREAEDGVRRRPGAAVDVPAAADSRPA